MWAYWPITLFWKTFGVFPVSLNRYETPILFTIFLLVACIYIIFTVPSIVCSVGLECTSDSIRILKETYPWVINVTSMLSRIALLYNVKMKFQKYKETLENYEAHSPTTTTEIERYKLFTFVTVTLCLVLILPVNAIRVHILLNITKSNGFVIMFYVFIYIQNLTMCCSETQFSEQCFMVYNKLKMINDDIIGLKTGELMHLSRYCVWQINGPSSVISFQSSSSSSRTSGEINPTNQRNDQNVTPDQTRSVANAVEALRIRHWLLREAIGSLNGLFGIQLGMSVCVLCVMLFFDIYYETFHVMGDFSLSTLTILYTWLLQYAVRYIWIIMISHFTTKQVLMNMYLL